MKDYQIEQQANEDALVVEQLKALLAEPEEKTNEYQDALGGESHVLQEIEREKITNPKKMIKLCKRMLLEKRPEVQVRLLRDILAAADPIKYAKECITKIRDCAIVVENFIADGHHGMIMIKDDVYPVTLSTKIKTQWLTDGKPWDPTDEMELQHHAAQDWMRIHDKGYFHGKVILFPQFGFSGVPRVVEMQCSKDVEGMTRYPGTNYFYEEPKKISLADLPKPKDNVSFADLVLNTKIAQVTRRK